jgi:phosphoglycolate phosphatase
VLWDVDGTLVHTGGLTARSFEVAVEQALGRPAGDHDVPMSGKTDPSIALEILRSAGATEEEAERCLPEVLERLEAEMAALADRFAREGRVLPGVDAVLERLHGHEAVLQSVLTGNTASNAAVKVRVFGIDRWLDLEVGAFGSDHHDRRELVPVAMARARKLRGRSFAPDQVWVVGDTPRDLECARAARARCLLVGTGRTPVEELRGLGADHVAEDLRATDEVCRLLVS